jgi:hypothetical protein
MSKSPRPPIPLRPDYTGAASVRALGLANAIARARERHGRESKLEPDGRRNSPRPKLGGGLSRGKGVGTGRGRIEKGERLIGDCRLRPTPSPPRPRSPGIFQAKPRKNILFWKEMLLFTNF